MKRTIRGLVAVVVGAMGPGFAEAQSVQPTEIASTIVHVQIDGRTIAQQPRQLQQQQQPQQQQPQQQQPQQQQQRQRQQQQQQQRRQQQQQREELQQRRMARGATAEANEPFARTAKLEKGGTFELQNVAGSITVTGGGGNEARIDAVKRVRAMSDANARAALDQIRIEVVERGGNVEVRTINGRVNPRMALVDYTVTLPAGANVILQTVSGDVRVQRLSGEVRAESYNGNVSAANSKRVRALRSMSGNIDVTDSESDELNADTLSGQILIRKLKGRVIDLKTITGNAVLQDVAAERAVVQSTAGALEYGGRLLRSGNYQFQTHSGNIRVLPAGNPGFDLEAMTYSGDLRSDFNLKPVPVRPAQPQRAQPQRTLRGTFGDAGAVLTASSFSGNIVIVKP